MFFIEYPTDIAPKFSEVEVYKVPYTTPMKALDFINHCGEILVFLPCKDGMLIVQRLNFYSDESEYPKLTDMGRDR